MSAGSLSDHNLKELLSHVYLPLSKKVPVFGPKRRVIVIAGPTGAGKTKLSLDIAKALHGEIISADSMQIYRGMDIGTAKASADDQKAVPHHLIDIADVEQDYNVKRYFEEASSALRLISAKGKVPIIVGGSGFYIQALLYGPPPGPPSDPEVRARLEGQMDSIGCEAMYEQLQMLDPDYAKTITEKDRHKVIRALEIMTLSEKKVSDFQLPTKMRNDEYDFRLWFLHYPREILYSKIEERCDQMVENGLVEEVKEMIQRGLLENSSASSAIGYKQTLAYLKSEGKEEDYREFIYEFKKSSRRYAKRQFTWFRKERFFRPLDLSQIDEKHAQEIIMQDYEQGH